MKYVSHMKFKLISFIAKYFVASACPTANDLNEGQYIPPSTKAGVMCCKQPLGSGCVSEGNCNVNAKTLQGAIFTCFIHGLRLCTRSELLSNICCGLNVHCDKVPVWSSTEEGGNVFFIFDKIYK